MILMYDITGENIQQELLFYNVRSFSIVKKSVLSLNLFFFFYFYSGLLLSTPVLFLFLVSEKS